VSTFAIRTDKNACLGHDPDGRHIYTIHRDAWLTFPDWESAARYALEAVGASWRVIELSPEGTFKCPHCQRTTPHEHIVDRKGYVHDC